MSSNLSKIADPVNMLPLAVYSGVVAGTPVDLRGYAGCIVYIRFLNPAGGTLQFASAPTPGSGGTPSILDFTAEEGKTVSISTPQRRVVVDTDALTYGPWLLLSVAAVTGTPGIHATATRLLPKGPVLPSTVFDLEIT